MVTTAQTLNDLAYAKNHFVKMMFFPQAWQAARTVHLTWNAIDFPPSPNSLPDLPGVYVFVVTTNIFDCDWAGGLFYIGKATSLYQRISSYIAEIDKDFQATRRPKVWKMVNQWNGYLKYFYTTTATVAAAESLETEMIEAFRPPFNTKYDAETSRVMRAF